MSPSLRKAVAAAIGGGAVAIASVLITGPSGDDGLEGVSYIPYKDIVGVWTVCHGHTGKDIMLGKTYTEAECKALLNKDLATVARQINPYIKVDIPETTRGALYSFVYNVGAGNFRTSTLLRKINQGDIKGACDQLRRWTYAGGKQWKGLMTRREIEREICLWGQSDRKGACEAIRWWIKDGGRDCRIRSNNCYGQVIRRDQESALACWGIDQ